MNQAGVGVEPAAESVELVVAEPDKAALIADRDLAQRSGPFPVADPRALHHIGRIAVRADEVGDCPLPGEQRECEARTAVGVARLE
ncbi:MAG: hypothetical protein MJE77_42595 [Proteobacteria bacterium]|nr:hypothetical protein [Pseudomonadota bacterium]